MNKQYVRVIESDYTDGLKRLVNDFVMDRAIEVINIYYAAAFNPLKQKMSFSACIVFKNS